MKGDILLQDVQVRGFIPVAAGKGAKDGKRKIKEIIETKLGKNIDNVRKRCAGKPLMVSVTFFLQNSVLPKKNLDSLSGVLLAVLSNEMTTGKEAEAGLDIIKDDSAVYKMVFEKKAAASEKEEGLAFSIYEWSY